MDSKTQQRNGLQMWNFNNLIYVRWLKCVITSFSGLSLKKTVFSIFFVNHLSGKTAEYICLFGKVSFGNALVGIQAHSEIKKQTNKQFDKENTLGGISSIRFC